VALPFWVEGSLQAREVKENSMDEGALLIVFRILIALMCFSIGLTFQQLSGGLNILLLRKKDVLEWLQWGTPALLSYVVAVMSLPLHRESSGSIAGRWHAYGLLLLLAVSFGAVFWNMSLNTAIGSDERRVFNDLWRRLAILAILSAATAVLTWVQAGNSF
jgi:hypothetical protein